MNHITTLSSLALNQLAILFENETPTEETESDPLNYYDIDDDDEEMKM
jgi:hypothetical protein